MNTPLTLYTLPSCVQCTMTKRALDSAGIPYTAIDLSTDEIALEYVQRLGYTTAPVVIAGQDHWSGFRPDKIAALTTTLLTDEQGPATQVNVRSEGRS